MKFLTEVPKEICNFEDQNYVTYCDTDSVYVHAYDILKFLYPDFESKSDKEKDLLLEKIALKYQDFITEAYTNLSRECFNASEHFLEMKTEAVIRAGYFRSTRRYAQWITKKEGIEVDELDIKGLEYYKSNFPKILGTFFNNLLIDILKGSEKKEIDEKVRDFKYKTLKQLDLEEIANPTAVKKLNKYLKTKPGKGELFSTIGKGAPASVKATIRYNDLLRFWGLNKKHPYIVQGDKIKWVYLKSNPYQIEAIAFLPGDFPKKIKELIETYFDREKTFESIFLNKLEGLYSDLNWELKLNPYQDIFFNLD